jgi:6-phosphofructokinase 1
MKIGILTGGGDCPGLNAVVRAVVKTAVLEYKMECLGIMDGFHGLIHNVTKPISLSDVSGILPRGGTILGSSNRDNPFKYLMVENGEKKVVDKSDQAMENLAKNRIDAMIVIGGDGTLSIAHQFHKKGVQVVGVPKTIDNDISATGVTFGFNTAVATATEAIDKIHTTAESHHRVMVIEVMGRDAGWIALHAGIAGGAHIILIPEVPFQPEKVTQAILDRRACGRRFNIVVVAEGAKPVGGKQFIKKTVDDPSNPARLGGIGEWLGSQIEFLTGIETRVTVLGHVQRGGTPIAFDRVLSTRFGSMAMEAVANGQFGTMVALRTPSIALVPLEEAIHQLNTVPVDGNLMRTARLIGIVFGD